MNLRERKGSHHPNLHFCHTLAQDTIKCSRRLQPLQRLEPFACCIAGAGVEVLVSRPGANADDAPADRLDLFFQQHKAHVVAAPAHDFLFVLMASSFPMLRSLMATNQPSRRLRLDSIVKMSKPAGGLVVSVAGKQGLNSSLTELYRRSPIASSTLARREQWGRHHRPFQQTQRLLENY